MQQKMLLQRESEGMIKMRRCITSLLSMQPFFGALALNMGLMEDSTRETIAADGTNIRFNQEWVAEQGVEQIRDAVARVVISCALKHHTRRLPDQDYGRWQRASKMVTTPLLQDMGLADANAYGMDVTVENAYELLKESDDEEDDGDKGSGQGTGIGPMAGAGKGQQDKGQNQDGKGQGQGQGGNQDQNGNGQSSGGGQGSSDPDGRGEIMDADRQGQGAAPLSTEELEQDWDQAMHQAMQMSKAQGKSPGNLTEVIEGAHRSQLNWRDMLRQFMQMHAKQDYTWSRPNRRHIANGLYLPSLHSESMPAIVLAVDTSASMDSEALQRVWSEILSITSDLSPEQVIVVQCDTKVHSVDEYSPYDLPEKMDIHGRGGTSFAPVFDVIEDYPTPACMIYFTDMGSSDFPDYAPGYPTLWAKTGGYGNVPPFGEVVPID